MLSDNGESRISSLADNSIAKHNEIFGELAAGRLPAKISCNPRNLIDISN
jgi:hypothetical protein